MSRVGTHYTLSAATGLNFETAVQRVREGANQTECRNNLRQIGFALHAYHESKGVFPPAFIFDDHYPDRLPIGEMQEAI